MSDFESTTRPSSSSQEKGGRSRLRYLLIGAMALILVAGAVAGGLQMVKAARHKTETRSAMAILETIGPVPSWLKDSDPKVIATYAWALEHHAELQYIPCYCGCETFGHTDNSTCYFKRDAKGAVTGYDEHALT